MDSMQVNENQVLEVLRKIIHPVSGKDLVTLGMIQDLHTEDGKISFSLYFKNPGDPLKSSLQKACKRYLKDHFNQDLETERILSCPWNDTVSKCLSIGFFVNPNDATIWRGPMASNAFQQLMGDSDWGELDYLFVDLPPGTSDIHLTLVQSVAVTGAVIVSTPQDVALADVVKALTCSGILPSMCRCSDSLKIWPGLRPKNCLKTGITFSEKMAAKTWPPNTAFHFSDRSRWCRGSEKVVIPANPPCCVKSLSVNRLKPLQITWLLSRKTKR